MSEHTYPEHDDQPVKRRKLNTDFTNVAFDHKQVRFDSPHPIRTGTTAPGQYTEGQQHYAHGNFDLEGFRIPSKRRAPEGHDHGPEFNPHADIRGRSGTPLGQRVANTAVGLNGFDVPGSVSTLKMASVASQVLSDAASGERAGESEHENELDETGDLDKILTWFGRHRDRRNENIDRRGATREHASSTESEEASVTDGFPNDATFFDFHAAREAEQLEPFEADTSAMNTYMFTRQLRATFDTNGTDVPETSMLLGPAKKPEHIDTEVLNMFPVPKEANR